MRVVVTGGGSGGHIMPAIAVAESLRRLRPETEVLFIGGSSGMETEIVPKYGIPFQAVTSRKLRKVLSPGTIGVILALMKGYREARTVIQAFGAEAVIGTGGYAAAATVLAGAHLGLPAFIHEANVLAGRTNVMLARHVQRVGVTFQETIAQFPAGKAVLTGMPLRAGIVAPKEVTAKKARGAFAGLEVGRFTVLVIGGSQGARALNACLLEAAAGLLEAGAQILHQTGVRNFEAVKGEAETRGLWGRSGYHLAAFFDEAQMPLALRAADMIVCRGGMSTLAEILVNGLPALVVPLPTAYADHQTLNAKALEAAGAALYRPESGLSAEGLTREVLELRDDAARRKRMAEAARALGRPDAADVVAKLVLKMKAG